MKMKTYLMLASVAVVLSACEKNDDTTPKEGVAAEITTNLARRVQSRMADDQWDDKDEIGVFTLNDELENVVVDNVAQSNTGVNLKYTLDGSTWDGGATAFRFKNPVSTDVTFKAYYPYQEDAKITPAGEKLVDGTIAVDASSQALADQKKFDFLFADKSDKSGSASCVGSKDSPKVKFQFKHSMAKVIIELIAGTENGVTFEQVKTMVPTLKGLKAKGTFSLKDGTVTANGDVTSLVLSNASADESSDPKTYTFVAIVPPQEASSENAPELSIAGGDNDTYRSTKILSGTTLAAGKSYKYTITVKKMELVVESSEITNWEAGTGGTGDAVLQ